MDLMDENLVDLIHHAVHFFGAKFISKGCKSFHVAEHDGDLFSFTFDLVPLGEYLLGDASGKVFLNLLNLLIKGEFFAGGFGGKCEVVAAVIAEITAWWILASTITTGGL